jgi:hypothetical protein
LAQHLTVLEQFLARGLLERDLWVLVLGWRWQAGAVNRFARLAVVGMLVGSGVALGQDLPTDAELRAAWAKQLPGDRAEMAEWFSAECERLDTYQGRLMRYVFGQLDQDRYAWEEAPDKLPLFDAQKHAPAQPIKRSFASEKSRATKEWRKRVARIVPEQRMKVAWEYDYGSGQVRRLAPRVDPERVFHNALAGVPPDLDLAEAIVERMLDDGSQRKTLAAFGHAYADRSGNAIPGVTLYDAWCTGAELEMPDVECLGVIHDVYGDWSTWTAPVPGGKQDALYKRLGAAFLEARQHRGLRSALARVYLSASPVVRDAYGPNVNRLHALWELSASDPARMAETLPGPADWTDWWQAKSASVDRNRKVWEGGQVRRRALEADAVRVRALMVGVMREYGALDG